VLFLISAFDAQTFCDIQARMKPSILATGEYSQVINGWRLRLFDDEVHRIVLVEATTPPAA